LQLLYGYVAVTSPMAGALLWQRDSQVALPERSS
jgi:hypothetical protein